MRRSREEMDELLRELAEEEAWQKQVALREFQRQNAVTGHKLLWLGSILILGAMLAGTWLLLWLRQ